MCNAIRLGNGWASSLCSAGAAFTCRYTAALRHVESTCVHHPVLQDELAPLLCGPAGLKLAEQELQNLQQHQGPGKHLRVPARTALTDQQLLLHLEQLASIRPNGYQVVSLGCGMDTRPWRLGQLSKYTGLAWFDVDQPEIADLKLESLQAANAETRALGRACPSNYTQQQHNDSSTASGNVSARPSFPLHCASYQMLGADLAHKPLKDVLLPIGFSESVPTVWILEAVIYYMPLEAASTLLQAMAELSAPGSRLVMSCIDAELLEASRSKMEASHVFANLWHFDHEELRCCRGYQQCWRTIMEPVSTKQLALSELQAETYVALYGGAECLMTSEVIPH